MTEEELVLNNMGLVGSVVKRFKPRTIDDMEDYTQVGAIGLLKAIRKYDKSTGNTLATLAWPYIYYHILNYINRTGIQPLPLNDRYPSYEPQPELWELLPKTLSKNEKMVIKYRLQYNYSFKEIGQLIGGYSRCWANKLYKSAIKKIQHTYE